MEVKVVRWKPSPGPPAGMDVLLGLPESARQALTQKVLRMPAGSRMRTRLLTDSVRAALELNNRHEWERQLRFFHPDIRLEIGGERPLDLEASYHGHSGLMKTFDIYEQAMQADWRLVEVLDPGGDHFAARTSLTGTGRSSGIALEWHLTFAYRVHYETGKVLIQHNRFDWDDPIAVLRYVMELES